MEGFPRAYLWYTSLFEQQQGGGLEFREREALLQLLRHLQLLQDCTLLTVEILEQVELALEHFYAPLQLLRVLLQLRMISPLSFEVRPEGAQLLLQNGLRTMGGESVACQAVAGSCHRGALQRDT